MRRPLRNSRPIGPLFSFDGDKPITVKDLRHMGQVDHYDPIEWAGETPERLYHNTDVKSIESIGKTGMFKTSEDHLNNVFLGANVGEVFGDFTLVFDGEACVNEGFSPRTYLIDEKKIYKTSEQGDYYETDRGVIWDERLIGCYPEPLYSSFKYPNTGSRCDPVLDIPFDVYCFAMSVFGLEPTGELEVEEPPTINLSGAMQQTFVRDIDKMSIKLSDLDVKYIMYPDRENQELLSHNSEIASEVAAMLDVKPITNRQAVDMFPELSSDKPAYKL